MSKTSQALYGTWAMMLVRCNNKGTPCYPSYGGRGIKVCDRWLNSFEAFASDMGVRPPGHTLDRIDNNGNYEPSNCRWATVKQQMMNRRNTRYATFDGVRYHLIELAEKYGINHATLSYRIAQNWPKERLLAKGPQWNNAASQKKAVAAHAIQKKAQKKCKRGHPLKGENLYVHDGRRMCRTCRVAWDRFIYYKRQGRVEDYLP